MTIVAIGPNVTSQPLNDNFSDYVAHKAETITGMVNVVTAFGVVGDGVADDTAALLLARDYTLTNGGVFYVPETANCYITATVDLTGIAQVDIRGTITGNLLSSELIIGRRSQIASSAIYYINAVFVSKIRIQGLKNGDVTINEAPHVLLWADGDDANISSVGYSRFSLGKVTTLELNSQGATIGWINENVFIGGRMTTFIMDGNYEHNSNTFYKPMWEGATIHIKKGNFNQFYNCRFEGTNTVTLDAGTTENVIERSWYSAIGAYLRQSANLIHTDNGNHNMVVNDADAYHTFQNIYEMTPASNNYNVKDFTKNEKNVTSVLNIRKIYESDFIEIVDDIGYELESDAALFRTYVDTYDSNKVKITTETSDFLSSGNMIWTATNTQYYTSTTQKQTNASFRAGTNVKYIKILVTAFTAGTFSKLRLMMIELKGKETQFIPLARYKTWNSDSVPTTGLWNRGDIVYNNTPTAGGYMGWTCILGDGTTLGTWKGFGLIEV